MTTYLVIGGVRSGKSSWAVQYARRFQRKTCIATAQSCDDDMRKRIQNHQRERGDGWTTIEEEIDLFDALLGSAIDSDVIVVDCLTVWTASLLDQESRLEQLISKWIDPLTTLIHSIPCDVVFVTNEVGLGIHPEYESGRTYRDLLGRVNQRFAQACDNVIWLTAGIPSAIKGKLPEVSMTTQDIQYSDSPSHKTDQTSRKAYWESAWRHLDQLTKPPRSLGRVEEIAVKLCQIQNSYNPKTKPRSVLVFAGDHGVCEEGVSAFPQGVTGEMLKNMASGGAAVSVLARLHQANLRVIDVGSRLPPDQSIPGILRCVVRPGTRNFTREVAMTIEETKKAVEIGKECMREEVKSGVRLMILGEMGIGNTTPASALCAAILRQPVQEITGRGTGLDDEGFQHKIAIVQKALSFHEGNYSDGYTLLSCLGGFELAAMTGAMLQAYEDNIPILLDGFIVSASALVAWTINPRISEIFIAAHASMEPGHRRILDFLRLQPILDLELRLGEASGALIALPILDAAAAIYNDMATFQTAGVSTKPE